MKVFKPILLFLFLTLSLSGFGQKQYKEVVSETKKKVEFGPDKAHYAHAFFNFLFATPPKEGNDADILFGKTHSVSAGARYRYKINDFFALGSGLNYTNYAWHFKQIASKKIPVSTHYDKEKIKINTLEAEAFMRIIIRQNAIGLTKNYVDLGGFIAWDFYDSRKFSNFVNLPDPRGFGTYTGIQSKLNYLNKINYGLELRLGHKKIAVFVKYRLSDLFTDDYKVIVSKTELPRLAAGLEISF